MKTFLKIKCIHVYDYDFKDEQTVVFSLRCGYDVVKVKGDYINQQTGEVYEPLYDEFKNELIGFIG